MPGSVDFIAIVLVALVAYVLWTPVYSREQPLKEWRFTVPLPRQKLEQQLVHEFQSTAKLWIDGVRSVERSSVERHFIRPVERQQALQHLVHTDNYDVITQFSKTGSFVWEEARKVSPLFSRGIWSLAFGDQRPGPDEISQAPAVDWAAEWTLNELSSTETEVRSPAPPADQRRNVVRTCRRVLAAGRAQHLQV